MLNRLGSQTLDHKRPPPPITMPAVNLPPLDDKTIEAEAAEAAAKIKTIRLGRTAWEQISKSASFESYLAIGLALAVGKSHALKVSGASWGRNYSREFGEWMSRYGFAAMPKSTRSVAIELAENIEAIERWRATLDERTRRRLVHPVSNVRRWRAATGQYEIQRSRDLKWDAQYAWRKFYACLQALPPDQAAPLLQVAQAELARLSRS